MPIRFAIIIHSQSNRNCLVIFSRFFLHLRGSRSQSRWNGAVDKCGGCCCWPLTTLNNLRSFAVWIPTTRTIFCWAMCSTKIVVPNACNWCSRQTVSHNAEPQLSFAVNCLERDTNRSTKVLRAHHTRSPPISGRHQTHVSSERHGEEKAEITTQSKCAREIIR